MDDLSFQQMREFIGMTKNLVGEDPGVLTEYVTPDEPVPAEATPSAYVIIEDLRDVMFRLRAFCESSEGDIGLGIEMGMQRAADMIENVINRHSASEE